MGVRIDVPIVVTFSEPMDEAATALSYEPAMAPAEQPVMSWNDDSTVLSIDAKLAYPRLFPPRGCMPKTYQHSPRRARLVCAPSALQLHEGRTGSATSARLTSNGRA